MKSDISSLSISDFLPLSFKAHLLCYLLPTRPPRVVFPLRIPTLHLDFANLSKPSPLSVSSWHWRVIRAMSYKFKLTDTPKVTTGFKNEVFS